MANLAVQLEGRREKVESMKDGEVSVVGATSDRVIRGSQAQALIPCITSATSSSTRLSAGIVVMPPGASSKIHVHEHSDIVVMVVAGKALTLVGDNLVPYAHAPGEFIFVPAGVLHMAVNLSSSSPLTAIEVRTDPQFNDDVVLCPERENEAKRRAEELRRDFEAGDQKRVGDEPGWPAPWMIKAHECVGRGWALKHSD